MPIKEKVVRPYRFSQKIGNEICARIANGETMRDVCVDLNMPSQETLFKWLLAFGHFRTQYIYAHEEKIDAYAKEIIMIADGVDESNNLALTKAKLRIDARKWAIDKSVLHKNELVSLLDLDENEGKSDTNLVVDRRLIDEAIVALSDEF